jgi:hypothetical protein
MAKSAKSTLKSFLVFLAMIAAGTVTWAATMAIHGRF